MAQQNNWKPQDFGFLRQENSQEIFHKFPYRLRKTENNMWLCTRKVRQGNDSYSIMTKFYFAIYPVDNEFAKWLLETRLNGKENDQDEG